MIEEGKMKRFMVFVLLILVACTPATPSIDIINTVVAQAEANSHTVRVVETVIITSTIGASITRPVETATMTSTRVILGKIITDDINLRSEPSINSSILDTLFKGEQITILGVSKDKKWVHVLSSIGYQGWVSVNLVKSRQNISDLPTIGDTSPIQPITTAIPFTITPTTSFTPTITPSFTPTTPFFPTSTQKIFPTITTHPTQIPTLRNTCISWKNAEEYMNQNKCIEGFVYKVYVSGTTTFIDFDGNYTSFYGVSFSYRWDSTLVGKCIHITGTIVPYKGRPEIIINNPNQVQFCE
jgi:uncharacterized protein YraI